MMMNYSFRWSLLLLALTPQVSAFSGSSTTPPRPSFMASSSRRRSIQQQSRLTSFTELSMRSLASASLSYEMFENAAKAQSQSLRCTEETEFLDDETEVRNGLFPLHNQDDNYTEEGCFE